MSHVALRRHSVFYTLKVGAGPAASKSTGAVFPAAFAAFCLRVT